MSTNTSIYKSNFFLSNKKLPFSNISSIVKAMNNSYINKIVNDNIVNDNSSKKMYEFTKDIVWACKKCGHIHIGVNPPVSCPICNSTYESK